MRLDIAGVIWPAKWDLASHLELLSPEGEIVGHMEVRRPELTKDIAKLVPRGYSIRTINCVIVGASGATVTGTVSEFGTSVVEVKAERTHGEMIEQMVRKEMRKQARALRKQREAEREEAENESEVVEDVEPAKKPKRKAKAQDAEPPAAADDPDVTGGDTDSNET